MSARSIRTTTRLVPLRREQRAFHRKNPHETDTLEKAVEEVELILRDARRKCAEMKVKPKAGAEFHRQLDDAYLARLDVISHVSDADLASFFDILAKI